MNLIPLGDKIVVKKVEAEGKSKGGILIPETAQKRPSRGKILAVGPGRLNEQGILVKMNVKEGQTVLFSSYAGSEVTLEDQELLIMREDDVLGIVQ